MKKITTKIIHIPYLEFTGDEISAIIISPITITLDTIFEIYTYKNNNFILSGSVNQWRALLGDRNYDPILFSEVGGITQARFSGFGLWFPAPDGFYKMRTSKDLFIMNEKSYKVNNSNSFNKTSNNFTLGCSKAWSIVRSYVGKIFYFRIERKNSLYKHYLPCVRFYNIVDDDNTIIYENLMDYGFFESVNQDYYIADPATIPAHTGDELLSDYSNLLNINGNVISYGGGGDTR